MQLEPLIEKAKAGTAWDLGNEILYEACRSRPLHTCIEDVIAKIWLIGRAYAAAIERRRHKTESNEDFYLSRVGPKILESDIDAWIANAREEGSWKALLEAHYKTTYLLNEISGLNKRSLASKYLHFHVPELFYLYDTRAVSAIRAFRGLTGRASSADRSYDNEYRKFAEKCSTVRRYVQERYGAALNPRELDNLLLNVQEKHPNESFKPTPQSGAA